MMSKPILKVKVQEYVETIYELPGNHFDNKDYSLSDLSDCEIASEFAEFGKKLFQTTTYQDDPISWDTRYYNHETNKWEEVNGE